MLTRRELLLVQPWQQRRYHNHRLKLKSALPAIDAAPPVARAHVCCKLKKVQREEENTARIEKDNFRLLRRMGAIMSHNRLDNHWITPPPNFLRRVGIYKPKVIPLPESPETPPRTQPSTRKSRCLACSTQSLKESLEQKQSNTRSVSTSTTNQSKSPERVRQAHSLDRQQVTLMRGTLHLSVKFPSQTTIKIHSGH